MHPSAKKRRDMYARIPGAPFLHREFWLMSVTIERWQKEEGLPKDTNLWEFFYLDPPGDCALYGLGWCEAPFMPAFEVKQIKDMGEREIIQDTAGRHLLVFKGRREGFMPDYLEHPVKDTKTWEENVKWRLDPNLPERLKNAASSAQEAIKSAKDGFMISQHIIGGYMYLRSLIGPEDLLYMFYDNPALIHDCMETWYKVADAVIAEAQKYVDIDELFMAEDICYNHGLLISPDMINEFLFPYYTQLISNIKARQKDKSRHLFIQIDTDGWAEPAIPVYQKIGVEVMTPFEVASGCDVVEIGKKYTWLIMSGGMDKRVLVQGKRAIDKMVERILPVMRARGGFTPTIDHGVPPETPMENYLYYRKRCVELGS